MEVILFFQSTFMKSWRQKLSGVHMYAQERGWFVQVIHKFANAGEIRKAIDEWHPIGCLVDRALSNGAPPDLVFRDIPTVYIDQNTRHRSKVHPCLLHDSAAEAALADRELLEMDRRSYGYCGTHEHYHWDADRLARFIKDMASAGIEPHILPQSQLVDAIMAMPKPCAILGANDDCAIRAFHAATAAGLSIPDDVAIIGIDNDESYCESVSPGLTSVEPDFKGAGYRLAQMLAEEIERLRSGKTRSRRLPPIEMYGPLRIVRRGSTSATSKLTSRVRRALEYIRRHACGLRHCGDGMFAQHGNNAVQEGDGTLHTRRSARTPLREGMPSAHEDFTSDCDRSRQLRIQVGFVRKENVSGENRTDNASLPQKPGEKRDAYLSLGEGDESDSLGIGAD